MDQFEDRAGADAVGAGEHATGAQHPSDLRERAILKLARRDVMEHREADGSRKPRIVEWELGDIALGDLDGVAELCSEPLAVTGIQLQHAQPAGPGAQHASRGSEPRSDLEHLVAELDTGRGPTGGARLRPAAPTIAKSRADCGPDSRDESVTLSDAVVRTGGSGVVSSTVAIASAAAPSSRPMNPIPSPRVALILTWSTADQCLRKRSPDLIADGASFGRSSTTVAST